MTSLLNKILPLALGAAASPMLFAATVLILAGRSRTHAHTLAFLAGVASPFIVLGLIVTLIVGPTFSLPRLRLPLSPTIESGFGAFLLLLALASLLAPDKLRPAAETTRDPAEEPGRLGIRFYGLGLTSLVLNPTAIALFVLAAAHIGQAAVGTLGKTSAFFLVIAVALAPIEVPLILDLAAPAYTQRVLKPIGQWARAHSRLIGAIVMALLGAYLLFLGLKAA